MAEPTLNLKYSDLAKAVAHFLRMGNAIPSDAGDLAVVDFNVQAGLRQFYWNSRGYRWSFMRKSATLAAYMGSTTTTGTTGTALCDSTAPFNSSMVGATVTFTVSGNTYTVSAYVSTSQLTLSASLDAADGSGKVYTIVGYSTYVLPDDYGGMATTRLTFADENQYPPVEMVSDELIRHLHQTKSTSTGRPRFAAVRAREHDGGATVSQRYELQFWPVPDAIYTLQYVYDVQVGKLAYSASPTVVDEYPVGGAMHAETILASCLAAAELYANDERGIHAGRFAELLAASVRRDQIMSTPDLIGNMNESSGELGSTQYVRTAGVEYEIV